MSCLNELQATKAAVDALQNNSAFKELIDVQSQIDITNATMKHLYGPPRIAELTGREKDERMGLNGFLASLIDSRAEALEESSQLRAAWLDALGDYLSCLRNNRMFPFIF